MSEIKSVVIVIILAIIFFILKKNNFFRGDGSSKKVNNNIVENLEVILDNTVYNKVEDMYVFYVGNDILIENKNVFYYSNKIMTELPLQDFLDNNNVIYKFFNIDEKEEFLLKQNENVILILFINIDILFLIDNNGVFVLNNSVEINNINFKLNNKKIKQENLIEFLNKEAL